MGMPLETLAIESRFVVLPVCLYSLVHTASAGSPSPLSTIPVIIPFVTSTVPDGISVIAIARDSRDRRLRNFCLNEGFPRLKDTHRLSYRLG